MKIIIASLFCAAVFASEPAKKQEPIKLVAPKQLANVDPATGKVTLLPGVKPEEVYNALLSAVQESNAKLQECEKKKKD